MPSLGLDIGGSSIKAALLGDSGDVVWENTSPRYSRPTSDQLLESLRAALDPCPVDLSKAPHVGLCVPGLLNADRTAIETSVNVPGLVGLPLADLVRAATTRPDTRLLLTSDAHAAAHDIWTTEHPHPPGRLLCLSLGTGVGACVLDDGTPLHVSGTSPGHIGQMDVSLGAYEDPCGMEPVVGWFRTKVQEWAPFTDDPARANPIGPDNGRGSLEAYIGLPALLRRYGGPPELILATLTADHAPLVALTRAIRVCHAIYRPHHVRLLGGVGVRLAPLVPTLHNRIARELTSVAREGWTLAAGTSDFHAARGAARLAAINEPFAPARQ